MTALIIHGHFYQPPRENPWTGSIERQPSAYPYHDWNERIHDECYGPNAFAHIIGASNTIECTLNNYANISFNFGPTLLSWLELQHPKTYRRIIEADKDSVGRRSGHGNAIAQAYGHAILPLCNERDRLTHVLWGLADFRFRFEREPESLWLPETACDHQTLELLIEQGLRFVILAPNQAERVLRGEGESYSVADGSIDPRRAYQYPHSDHSGRSIAIFFYDGPSSRAIAFERVLSSSQMLVEMFKGAAQGGAMVNVATDGETYGHHFKLGDLALAHALAVEAREQEFQVTNYGEFLARHPPEFEVEIKSGPEGEGTSWSCAHGVGRWIRDCGCHTGGEPGWRQQWRGPLRLALDFLRDEAARQFESVGADLLIDPWATRNYYIELILDHGRSRAEFLARHSKQILSPPDQMRALTLLEIQRNALLMYTSCGWFFSELSGIETLQILKYAARVIELMDELGLPSPRARFLGMLAAAESNIPAFGTGADLYLRFAEPAADVVPSYS
ncbi:MAG TPA: DUF3536 domain-containing protein [Pyrinomonadaceae bacterium]|nr:DUF3536 domain-containing protein [Pyrinomonadaceae bacterium]